MTPSPDPAAGYDAQALADIHALPASPGGSAPAGALVDIASILVRADRPPWPSRIIIAAAGHDAHEMLAARVDADGTQVFLSPNGPGLLIQLSPLGQADADAPERTVAGTLLRQPGSPRGRS